MRDKLIELLQGMHNAVCDAAVGWLDSASYADQLNVEADYLIAHGVTFADVPDTNVGKWIAVSEPPKETGEYIVKTKGGEKATSLWYSKFRNGWYEFSDDNYTTPYEDVTHWMPLPEPPKEDE